MVSAMRNAELRFLTIVRSASFWFYAWVACIGVALAMPTGASAGASAGIITAVAAVCFVTGFSIVWRHRRDREPGDRGVVTIPFALAFWLLALLVGVSLVVRPFEGYGPPILCGLATVVAVALTFSALRNRRRARERG
jgi:O-antigen/teichoic acid export membrane protein